MAGMPFDMSSLSSILNDPSIKAMAEQISHDPQFQALARQMQAAMGAGEGSGDSDGAGAPPRGMDFGMGGAGMGGYMSAMQNLLANPSFMQMAEKVGQQIMKDPTVAPFMGVLQDPSMQTKMQERMNQLKDDPDLGPVIKDMQEQGMEGMMKHWNNPEILAKFGEAMGDLMPNVGAPAEEGQEAADGEEGPAPDTLLGAAADGDAKKLAELIKGGADLEEKDEEGRTAIHFACGYGEFECAKVLLEAGASPNVGDNNNNTALHYAAGYGQADIVKLLLDHKADVSAKNEEGKTAKEVAELNEQKAVVALLK